MSGKRLLPLCLSDWQVHAILESLQANSKLDVSRKQTLMNLIGRANGITVYLRREVGAETTKVSSKRKVV